MSLKFFYEWIPFVCRCARRGAGARIGRPSAGGGDGARKVDPRRDEDEDGGSGSQDEDEDLSSGSTDRMTPLVGEAQEDGPPPKKRTRRRGRQWYRQTVVPKPVRGALDAPRTRKDKLLCEAWARAGVQKKKSMWFKATTVQRRHLFRSSTISLRKALLQWPPQTKDFEAERAALGKVLHQQVVFQDVPVKKASLQRRPGNQEFSSSPSSSGGQIGGSSSRVVLSKEGSRQQSHDWKKQKRIGEAEDPGPFPGRREQFSTKRGRDRDGDRGVRARGRQDQGDGGRGGERQSERKHYAFDYTFDSASTKSQMNSTRWANPPPRSQHFLDSRKVKSRPAVMSRGGGRAGPGLGSRFRPPLRQLGQFQQTTRFFAHSRRREVDCLPWKAVLLSPTRNRSQSGPKKECWYGKKCRHDACPFEHPSRSTPVQIKPNLRKSCWYGENCKYKACPFDHRSSHKLRAPWSKKHSSFGNGWQTVAHSRGACLRPNLQTVIQPARSQNRFAPLQEVGRQGETGGLP